MCTSAAKILATPMWRLYLLPTPIASPSDHPLLPDAFNIFPNFTRMIEALPPPCHRARVRCDRACKGRPSTCWLLVQRLLECLSPPWREIDAPALHVYPAHLPSLPTCSLHHCESSSVHIKYISTPLWLVIPFHVMRKPLPFHPFPSFFSFLLGGEEKGREKRGRVGTEWTTYKQWHFRERRQE